MPQVPVRIPQIGEGLQEARLVAVLKNPGDSIKRDEPIYQMETDKAVMDVESPYEGTLVEWLAPVDAILPIGGEVAIMDVVGAVDEVPAAHGQAHAASTTTTTSAAPTAGSSGPRRTDVPPRTRAYAKEKGVTDEQLAEISAKGSRLMPEDIDAYLAGGAVKSAAPASNDQYAEQELGQKQRLLSSRLVRGNQLVVPGTISVACNWTKIEALRAAQKANGGDFQPSSFTAFAYAVSTVLRNHPLFRSTMVGDSVLRTYHHTNLGIAVGLDSGDLVIAVVDQADALDWPTFAQQARAQIEKARGGQDQANESVTISLTNMQNFGLRDAVPVVVPPSVATLFIGEIYQGIDQQSTDIRLTRFANLGLTFDHRVINGVDAAKFLNDIKEAAENIDRLIQP